MSDYRGGRRGSGGERPPRGGGRGGGGGGRGNYPRDNQAPRGNRGGGGRPQEGQQRRSDAEQSSTGYGYQERGGPRGGNFGGGGRGSRTEIRYSNEKLSLDLPHVDGPRGFKCQDLPEDEIALKSLIPKTISPGTLSQKKVHIKVNFFLAKVTLPKELYRYEVDLAKIVPEGRNKKGKPGKKASPPGEGEQPQQPPTLNKDLRFKIFKWLIPRIHAAWAAANPRSRLGLIHDFSRIMITTRRLDPTKIDFEYVVPHSELEDEDDSDVSYRVTINPAVINLNIPRLQAVLDDLKTSNSNGNNEPGLSDIAQYYNILLKNIGGDAFLPLGRNSLLRIPENERATYLGAGLCNWQGIFTNYTMESSWKPYINIDIQNSAVRIGQPVINAVRDVLEKEAKWVRFDDVTTWRDNHFAAVLELLKSCKVTRQVGGRRYDGVVCDVVRKPASAVSFKCEELNNSVVTLPEYFKRRYNLNITYPKGLVLQIGQKAKVPAEMCTIKKGQSFNRMLTNEVVTKNMVTQATEKPHEKEQSILRAIRDLEMTSNTLLKDFGVNFNNELLDLKDTRVLSPPELCYGVRSNDQQPANGTPNRGRIMPQNGEWDQWSHGVQFFKPMKIENWAVLILDDDNSDPRRFITELRNNGQNIGGMTIPEPTYVVKRNDICERENPDRNIDNIAKILRQWKESWPKDGKSFVLVVIPKKGGSLYNQVKQAAELHVYAGVLTQCVIKKNFDMANHSVVKNILLKVNCKLGGINHVPIIPKHLNKIDILKTPVMIVGIDVNHPPAGQGGKVAQPSFAAVTASIDRSGMPYMMRIQAQVKAERGAAEVVQNLDVIIKDMLIGFFVTTKKNTGQGIKPSKIIVYRDGVGTSQFPEVLNVEMRAIRRACEKLMDDDKNPYRPKITIVAVQKRHKVRFFLKNPNGGTENAPPGTVVDTEICTSDFYLLSHKGMLGTSRPTHYQVLWDDSDFTSDEIQALSYYLCYMYSRCNRSASYPAPTYYAHWAAKRANILCKIGGHLPNWWDGSDDSLRRLNMALCRNNDITTGFPMHFV